MMRLISLCAALSLFCWCTLAQTTASPATAASAAPRAVASLPHDQHEGVTVSADPYTEAARAKEKFGKANPLPVGILPVEVFLRNDTDHPIRVNLDAIQLVVRFADGRHQDIDWLAPENVAVAVAHPGGSPAPRAPRFPIDVRTGRDTKAEKLAEILRPLTLDADIVPPMAMIHGFSFFDLGRNMSLVRNASLYVPDAAALPSNHPLMFFEVFLGTTSSP